MNEINSVVGNILPHQISFPPLSIIVSFWIYNTICIVSDHHGETDVTHEYAKSEMRLLSSLESFCTGFMPKFVPILVWKSWFFLIIEVDLAL